MDVVPAEKELIRKLVTTWHLTGHERRSLPGGKIRGSLICQTITETLDSEGRFPVEWQPDDSFAGGVIETTTDGGCRVTWKADESLMHREAVSIKEFASPKEAVPAFARTFFGGDIDGVPIDWSA
jgi:hypothetical protein